MAFSLRNFWKSAPIEAKAVAPATLAYPDPALFQLFGSMPTKSGVDVSPYAAMRVPAVAQAVGLIATTVGTMPCKVLVAEGQGGKTIDTAHPAHPLVATDANPWTSATALREQLTTDALLHGAGYAFVNRVNGRAVEFIRLLPGSVSKQIDTTTLEPSYRVGQGTDVSRVYGYEDILEISAFNGVSPIALAKESIGLALTLETHCAKLFANGARPGGVLKLPGKIGDDGLARLKASWQGAFGGANSGATAILEEGADFSPITFSSVDAELSAMRAFQIQEIARAFNVPVSMLGDLSRATWSNIEQQALQFLAMTLLPWLRTWESAYRRVLLAPEERDTHSIVFDTDDLLRGDSKARSESIARMRAAGVMTANEAREQLGLPNKPEGDVLENPFTAPNPTGLA